MEKRALGTGAKSAVPQHPARGRRGLIAGAMSVAAFMLGKLTSAERVQAADNDPMLIGVNNQGSANGATTRLTATTAAGNPALRVTNGSNPYTGPVNDVSDAIQGYTNAASTAGVFGRNDQGTGVYGSSSSGTGVQGVGSVYGVLGFSTAGKGVRAASTSNAGLHASSQTGAAIYAETFGSAYGIDCRSLSGDALLAVAQSGSARAGRFVGDVLIEGAFQATGTKSAIVSHPDGTHRLLYCLESPESYFEDLGEARLEGGVARVGLDRDFAALVRTDNYFVFLTEIGDNNALFVSRRTKEGFEVRAKTSTTATSTFCYRVVARRADVEAKAKRLDRVTMPGKPEERRYGPSDIPELTDRLTHVNEPQGPSRRVND